MTPFRPYELRTDEGWLYELGYVAGDGSLRVNHRSGYGFGEYMANFKHDDCLSEDSQGRCQCGFRGFSNDGTEICEPCWLKMYSAVHSVGFHDDMVRKHGENWNDRLRQEDYNRSWT